MHSKGRIRPQRGKRFPTEAEAPVPVACTPRTLLEAFSPVPAAAAARAPLPPPRCQSRPEGHLQSICLQGQPSAACQEQRKTRNRKALRSLPQPSCHSHYPVTPSFTTQATAPPQTYNLLIPVLFSKKPRRRGDGQLLAGVGGLQEPCSHPSMSQAGPYAIAFPQAQGIAWRDLCRAAWKENKPALELCKIICHSERLAIWVAPSLTLEDRIWARMPVV